MTAIPLRASLAPLACLALLACGSAGSGGAGDVPADTLADAEVTPGADALADAEVTVPPCRSTHRPIIFAHGLLAAGDTWAPHIMRFVANGYCEDELYRLDWNTLAGGTADAVDALDLLVDHALSVSGKAQVDLVGHSAGGGLGYAYLADAPRAARVARYAHVASSLMTVPAGPDGATPTLNLWSESDAIIKKKGDIPGATNVTLAGADHYQAGTSPESFDALYRFFNDGAAPQTSDIVPAAPILVSGKVLALGENIPASTATVAIYEVDPATGARAGEPVAVQDADADGNYGPVVVRGGVPHEFVVTGATESGLPIHYYREPFVRSNPAVYLRTLPASDSLAGSLISDVPFDDPEQSVIVVFTASQATIHGRDTLTVQGLDLATEALATEARTAIAWFLYDADKDGETGGDAIPIFTAFPFLNGVDAWFEPGGPALSITFQGRTLVVPAWRAGVDGPVVATFD
jgi:pimeloyl-ACP methyl ester carboxylesterase